ncbi:uncharacterized protein L969DRAFT_15936 [Mixia osmundae IAM 14324]|uniref:uncharacterized protein n=1 Tax=Mixia osmundae (strain CBS 9802 / IAM 14324 / JCM 22182 / KY 12970) TaxID=764103 RepID=UPI0004A546E4|nr:uncharacterized protein L969DRAFT_15936 [Mixia osmundae IAM 14324]KEI40580.1 hypothetical protein L969DRAFT_15936 [Mixia osmundae IAM 14324]
MRYSVLLLTLLASLTAAQQKPVTVPEPGERVSLDIPPPAPAPAPAGPPILAQQAPPVPVLQAPAPPPAADLPQVATLLPSKPIALLRAAPLPPIKSRPPAGRPAIQGAIRPQGVSRPPPQRAARQARI